MFAISDDYIKLFFGSDRRIDCMNPYFLPSSREFYKKFLPSVYSNSNFETFLSFIVQNIGTDEYTIDIEKYNFLLDGSPPLFDQDCIKNMNCNGITVYKDKVKTVTQILGEPFEDEEVQFIIVAAVTKEEKQYFRKYMQSYSFGLSATTNTTFTDTLEGVI